MGGLIRRSLRDRPTINKTLHNSYSNSLSLLFKQLNSCAMQVSIFALQVSRATSSSIVAREGDGASGPPVKSMVPDAPMITPTHTATTRPKRPKPRRAGAWLLGCLETITSASSSSGIVAPYMFCCESCFAPLVRTLFFAARPFRPRKNVSLAPRVPMSTFSKPSEPTLPRNCRRH